MKVSARSIVEDIINVENMIVMLEKHKKKMEELVPLHILMSERHFIMHPEEDKEQYLADKEEWKFLEQLRPNFEE